MGVLRTPSVLALWLRPRAYNQGYHALGPASLFLLLTYTLALMVRPYADSSELSCTNTMFLKVVMMVVMKVVITTFTMEAWGRVGQL